MINYCDLIATWVSRFPSDNSLSAINELGKIGGSESLAPAQRDKFSHFFTYLLDHDRDGYISRKDFALFSEVEFKKFNFCIILKFVEIIIKMIIYEIE